MNQSHAFNLLMSYVAILIFLASGNGCFRPAKKQTFSIDEQPSFVVQGSAVDCDCHSTGEWFSRAELGLDLGTYDFQWQVPKELLSLLQKNIQASGCEVLVRSVKEVINELAERSEPGPSQASLLIHQNSHIYLLLGTVMIGDVLTFQIVHGDSPVWLVDQKTLEKAHFIEAWQFRRKNKGIPISVGDSILLVR